MINFTIFNFILFYIILIFCKSILRGNSFSVSVKILSKDDIFEIKPSFNYLFKPSNYNLKTKNKLYGQIKFDEKIKSEMNNSITMGKNNLTERHLNFIEDTYNSKSLEKMQKEQEIAELEREANEAFEKNLITITNHPKITQIDNKSKKFKELEIVDKKEFDFYTYEQEMQISLNKQVMKELKFFVKVTYEEESKDIEGENVFIMDGVPVDNKEIEREVSFDFGLGVFLNFIPYVGGALNDIVDDYQISIHCDHIKSIDYSESQGPQVYWKITSDEGITNFKFCISIQAKRITKNVKIHCFARYKIDDTSNLIKKLKSVFKIPEKIDGKCAFVKILKEK